MSIDELYQDLILEHFRQPRFRGALPDADARFIIYNPLCGDKVEVAVMKTPQGVGEIKFDGSGCSISQASASIMTELCRCKSAGEVKELYDLFQEMLRHELPDERLKSLGDAAALQGVRQFPVRVKCATLAWEALMKCLAAAYS